MVLLASTAAVAVEDADELFEVEGWVHSAEGYRLRSSDAVPGVGPAVTDHDARLLLDGGARTLAGRLALDVSGVLFWDIDGTSPRLTSVHDSKGPLDLIIDTLELRAASDPVIKRASFGRLTIDEGWPITLDGVAFAVAPIPNWTIFFSGGRSVYFFGQGPDEWSTSLGTDFVVDQVLKLQLDYRALVTQNVQHSYGAAMFARYDESLLHLYARALDSDLERVGARARLARSLSTTARLGLDIDAAQQVLTLGEIFEGGNPFFAILGESKPHVRGSADAWGRLDLDALDLGLHLGAAGRSVLSGEQEAFNRNTARVYASLDGTDLFIKGPFVSVVVSYDFVVAAGQDDILAVGGSAGYATEGFRFSLGTAFDRVRYTYYRDVDELTDVRSFFGAVEVRPLPWLRVKGDYTLELADRQIHTAQILFVQDLGGEL